MAFVIITSGPQTGKQIDIAETMTIGRASDTNIPLDDSAVSGHHCSITRDGAKYTLRDLGSTNGTRLNGKPVHESRLRPGDVITVGSSDFTFDGSDVEVEASPADRAATPVAGGSAASAPNIPVSSAFTARRNSHGIWFAVILPLCLLALAALGWFLFNLFKS